MGDVPDDNQAQIRAIVKTMVETARVELGGKVEVPAPLKWGAGIFAGVLTVGSAGLLFWMVSTISATQLTVVRIDERQTMNAEQWDAKFEALELRMDRLEQQQRLRVLTP